MRDVEHNVSLCVPWLHAGGYPVSLANSPVVPVMKVLESFPASLSAGRHLIGCRCRRPGFPIKVQIVGAVLENKWAKKTRPDKRILCGSRCRTPVSGKLRNSVASKLCRRQVSCVVGSYLQQYRVNKHLWFRRRTYRLTFLMQNYIQTPAHNDTSRFDSTVC